MTSIKDWVLSQVISKSFGPTRFLSASESFISQENLNDEIENQGLAQTNDIMSRPRPTETPFTSSDDVQTAQNLSSATVESSSGSNLNNDEKNLDPLAKVEAIQITFLRLLQRLRLTQDNLTVAKVLYRIHLATLIRAGESDLHRANFKINRADAIAARQEELGRPKLSFSLKILVLGKSGVGKSSTINSILGETKVMTNAFQPATTQVQEIVGVVNGIRISFIDTPGLLPSSAKSDGKNRKILGTIKRFIQKSCPDVVLYFERLDLINMGSCDLTLLKLITEVLGPDIWFSANIVMTHSCAALPENENGHPVSYESFISYCGQIVQHNIHQAIFDTRLENPTIFVENHPYCRVDISGEKILPNGQIWVSQFLLLCICTKVLGDVNNILDFKDSIQLGPVANSRSPSLPHLLSSFLKHEVKLIQDGGDSRIDELSFSDLGEEDEYDQLPPIRILTSAQFRKLTPSQKNEYLDELDYRETLYLKKHMKQEYIRKQREVDANLASDDDSDDQTAPEAYILPDIAIPPSFDSDSPVHRFRCLATDQQLFARPVLDPHGWDHDVGFDGINFEMASEVRKHFPTSVMGQLSKDKQEFTLQCESMAAFLDPRGPAYSMGLDFQSAGKELICSARSNAKLGNFKHNTTECGVSIMSFGGQHYCGAKIEDVISPKNRMKFKMNVGGMTGTGQVAYGGSFEARLNGKDYPVRHENVSVAVTMLSYEKEMVLGGSIQSDFRLSRGTNISVNANVNSRKAGQVCVKINSSDHMEVALVALISLFRCLLRKRPPHKSSSRENPGTG